MTDNLPLVDNHYLLEKFSGKGGWTYARVPEIPQDKSAPFGWVRVCGSIDGVEINGYHLMPMGNGQLFLPIKAAIRKQIKKQAGDKVHVILYPDSKPLEIPAELMSCFDDEPGSFEKFRSYSNGEQKAFVDWIYSAKSEITKANRIAKTIDMIIKGESLFTNTSK